VTVIDEEVLGADAGFYSVDILLNREGRRGVIVEVRTLIFTPSFVPFYDTICSISGR
jgi:hypothetical protein